MIKNTRQFDASHAHRRRLLDARARCEANPLADPLAQEWALAGIDRLLGDVDAELAEYEALLRDGLTAFDVADLPAALVKARIAAGLTEEDLAARLGVSAQDVQKAEDNGYANASLATIRQTLDALGAEYRQPLVVAVRRTR
jgi:HTH-type transcriptional regulator / antitoxin HipB